jgi:glutaredoxin 3
LSNQRTVPNVFVKGRHVGGNDATQAAIASGELQKALAAK